MITRLPKQARSPLVPHLQSGYHTPDIISTARNSFGDAVVEVIDAVIDWPRCRRLHVTHFRPSHTPWPVLPEPSGPSSLADFRIDKPVFHFDK